MVHGAKLQQSTVKCRHSQRFLSNALKKSAERKKKEGRTFFWLTFNSGSAIFNILQFVCNILELELEYLGVKGSAARLRSSERRFYDGMIARLVVQIPPKLRCCVFG